MFSEVHYSVSKPLFASVTIILLLSLFLLSSTSQASQAVKLTTKLWPPYHYYDEDTGNLTGVSVEVLKCSFQKINTPLEIEVMPWARAQLLVQKNLADGFFSASWNAQRDEYAVRTNNIAPQKWAWYTLKQSNLKPDNPIFKSSAKIASTIGSNIMNWLQKEDYDVQSQITSEQMIKMLLAKRVDAIMGNELVIDNLLNDFPEKSKLEKQIARSMPVGVYFSKDFLSDKPTFIDELNEAIALCAN